MSVVSQATVAGYLAARVVRGVSITYSRGATSVALTALAGNTDSDLDQMLDMRQLSHLRAFIVLASELTLGEPALRDTIAEGTRTYRVLEIDGAPCWRYSDPDRVLIRVTTTQVA